MGGNSIDVYEIIFPGADAWEHWLFRDGEASLTSKTPAGESLDFDPSIRSLRVFAQPSTYQISLPFASNAADPGSLVQSAHLHVEKQGSSYDQEGIMVEAIFGQPPNTVARIDVPLTKHGRSGQTTSLPDLVVPAATLLPLERNSITIWNELGNAIVAFERDGKVVYYDRLGSRDSNLVDEVYHLMTQLSGVGLIHSPERLSLWGDIPKGLFERKIQLPAEYGPRPAPGKLPGRNTLSPLWFRQGRSLRVSQHRDKRRVLVLLSVLGIVGFILAIVFLIRFAQVKSLRNQIALIKPTVDRIESIRSRWDEVATGVDPDSSFLEIWKDIFSLQHISSIKVEHLIINRSEIQITGNAASASQALDFIDEITTSDLFNSYDWEYQPPVMTAGGLATFDIKGSR